MSGENRSFFGRPRTIAIAVFGGRADRPRRRCADCGRPSGGQRHGSGDQDDTDCGNRPRDRLPFSPKCAELGGSRTRHIAAAPTSRGRADGGEGSGGPNGAPRSEDTPARAGSAIPAKTVNTKTDNASNFFVMVVLLKQATSRIGMLSQFENGRCTGGHSSSISFLFQADGDDHKRANYIPRRWAQS